jgi:prevent-host-death family protein
MKTVNVYDAKTHLSQLLAEVERGEEVVIARNGQPIARLGPVQPPVPRRRVLGQQRHLVLHAAADAFAPMSEAELEDFEADLVIRTP